MNALIAVWYLTFSYPGAIMGKQFGPFESETQCNFAREAITVVYRKKYPGWEISRDHGTCFQGVK